MFAITLEVLEGKNPGVGVVFSRANRLGTGFGQLLLMYLAMLLILSPLGFAFLLHEDLRWKVLGGGMLVLAIPLAYVGMGFAFSMLEIAYNPKATALSAIKTSFALVSGHRWRIVLMGVASVAIIFAGVLACCVGVVPAFGLATTVFCSMYLALRNGSDQLAG
jgi:uncharacterized membrane protein